MTKDKAMKMAFFAMLKIKENKSDPAFTYQDVLDAIEALRAALAQPEPEPVAYWVKDAGVFTVKDPESGRPFAKEWEPLYTAPPQRKPLSDEQIIAIAKIEGQKLALQKNLNIDIDFARAIEAKLKEKNNG